MQTFLKNDIHLAMNAVHGISEFGLLNTGIVSRDPHC